MKSNQENPYEVLGKIFHEPGRLAIMSVVCAGDNGLSFNEIKEACGLTDGNLNRHLKVLQEAGAIKVKKSFVENKPRTTVFISQTGLQRFNEYLSALSDVLDMAKQALPKEIRKTISIPLGRTVRA